MPADVDYDRALDRAIGLVARRSRSRWEVRDRLRRAGFDDHVVAKVEARLMELRILDDHAFALESAEQSGGRGVSFSAIRVLLAEKGVDPETIERALDEVGEESDSQRALDLARRRARNYRDLPAPATHRRLAAFLLRKGYEEDLVEEICRRVLADRH